MSNQYTHSVLKEWFYSHLALETDECIVWPFYKINGYGRINIEGKRKYVCELVCEIKYGHKPGPEYDSCHGPCHNRSCINYRHLYWGTRSQNMLDRERDGTNDFAVGIENAACKLNEEQVFEIRKLYREKNLSYNKIANMFGLNRSTISLIISGKTWQHLLPEPKLNLFG
jgi:hypothetical protein